MLQGFPSAKVHPNVVSKNFTHLSSSAASHHSNLAISFALVVADGPGCVHTVDDVSADSMVAVSAQLMWTLSIGTEMKNQWTETEDQPKNSAFLYVN